MTQINLTSTADVTLKTAGKYCEDDIQIVQNLEEITATPTDEVQEFVPSEGKNGISRFVVNETPTEDVEVKSTEDTELVMPSEGKFIRKVTVKQINLQNKSVTPSKESQTIVKDGGFDALKMVSVEPIPDDYIIPEGSLDISQNGTYDVTSLKSVVVNIVGDGGAIVPMEVNLPEGFRQKADYYYLQMSGSKILMSNSGAGSGLWEYTVQTKNWVKLYDGGKYQYFQKVGNNCIIGSNGGYLLLYSARESRIIQTIDNRFVNWNRFDLVGENYFCYSTTAVSGLVVYDSQQEQLVDVLNSGYNWTNVIEAGENYIVSSNSSSVTGIYLYEPITNQFTKILNVAKYAFTLKVDVSDNIMLLTSTNSSNKGIVVYNKTTKTAEMPNTTWYSSLNVKSVENDVYIISSKSSSSTGIILYKESENIFTQIYSIGYNWTYVHVIGGVYLFSSSSTSNSGIVLHNPSTNETAKVYASGSSYSKFEKVGNNCVIAGSTSYGVLLFDGETKTISQIETKAYVNIFAMGNICFLAGASSSALGVLIYDNETKTISTAYETGYNYTKFALTKDNCLISGGLSTTGILLYDSDTKTISLLHSGNQWNIFHDVEDGNYLISRAVSGNIGVLLYDSSTKTISRIAENCTWFSQCYKLASGEYLLTSNHADTRDAILYNPVDKTAKTIGVSIHNLKVVYDMGGDCFLTASSAGIYLYDIDEEDFDTLFPAGYSYDTFEETDSQVLISASDKEDSIYTLEYDKATKTAEPVSIYVS